MQLPSLVPSSTPVTKPVDVSIIIAHRGPEMGLWLTLESCILDLEQSGLSYEFRICANGEEKLTEDLRRVKFHTEQTGKLGEFLHIAAPTAPPTARQILTENANGKYLFFFDNHCIVMPGYFTRAVGSMETYGIDLLHSSTRFFSSEGTFYEYKLSLKRDFWTHAQYKDALKHSPYRIAVAGHGGFAARASAWKECDGYWQGFEGYGGEETYTDLKFWLLGKEVWIDPQMVHLHWAGERKYKRHFTDNYYKNIFMCANLIGGEKWMHTVFNSALRSTRFVDKDKPVTPIYDLLMQAENKSKHHAEQLAKRRTKTLDELLVWFAENNIRT